jgi:hypothetical protein
MQADWARLGIDATTDRTVIRRAYATRLKAMDVDADPDGFAALRDARDAALAWAAGGSAITEGDGFALPEPPPFEPDIDPQEQAFVTAIEAHFTALHALLFPDHDDPPTSEELAAIEHHGRALLNDPRMEQVDFATGAESWFAEMLAHAVPRSDPLLEPAAALFGWIDRRHDYALPGDAQAVVERIGATRFVALVSDPTHRLHRAWRELTMPGNARRDWLTGRSDIRELLNVVRRQYPDVEGWLTPARLERWDERLSGKPIPTWAIRVLIVIVLVTTRLYMADDNRPPIPRPSIASTVPDADVVARGLTGQNAAQLARTNPGLAKAIDDTLATLDGTTDAVTVRKTLDALYQRRMLAGLANASPALLRDLAAFEIDGKERLRTIDPVRCRDFAFPAYGTALPASLDIRQQGLLRRVMLESDGTIIAAGSCRFILPAAMIRAIARRTGFDRERVERAVQGKGEPADICRVQIALLETARASGDDGTALLRDMQPSAEGK